MEWFLANVKQDKKNTPYWICAFVLDSHISFYKKLHLKKIVQFC